MWDNITVEEYGRLSLVIAENTEETSWSDGSLTMTCLHCSREFHNDYKMTEVISHLNSHGVDA